jgi:hypothetical protein
MVIGHIRRRKCLNDAPALSRVLLCCRLKLEWVCNAFMVCSTPATQVSIEAIRNLNQPGFVLQSVRLCIISGCFVALVDYSFNRFGNAYCSLIQKWLGFSDCDANKDITRRCVAVAANRHLLDTGAERKKLACIGGHLMFFEERFDLRMSQPAATECS